MDAKEKSGEYISKKDGEKIKTYLQKKYLLEVQKQINKEIAALEKFLKNTSVESFSGSDALKLLYSKQPKEIKNYINPVDISDDEYIDLWKSEPYQAKKISEAKSEKEAIELSVISANMENNLKEYSESYIGEKLYDKIVN